MEYEPETPFDSVESAQQFVELLSEAIDEAKREIESDLVTSQPERRMQALQIVAFKLNGLSKHMAASHRLLNDLRLLRRLLLGERASEAAEKEESAASGE